MNGALPSLPSTAFPTAWLTPHPLEAHAGAEFSSPGAIRALQLRLLRDHLRHAALHSPFYRERFRANAFDAARIGALEDLAALPCTTKEDLCARNADFLAVPPETVADVCLTSASTGGTPCSLLQTPSDLARLAHNEAAAFAMLGLGRGDTLLVCAALDRCFMAGLAYFLGGSKRGARMVRAGAGSAAQHWQTLRITGANVLVGVPSLLRRIAEHALDEGESPARAGVRLLVGIGEPTRGGDLELLASARRIESLWGAPLHSTYASTEMATSFCECPQRCGGHVRPELVVTEIVDEAGRPLPPGEPGEVVVTPLGVEGMPLVRFRTGDVAYLLAGRCACGRESARLSPVLGRKHQMLKFKGTTLFPEALLAVAEGRPDVAAAWVEAHEFDDGTDRVVLCVHWKGAAAEAALGEELRGRVRVVPEIRTADAAEAAERLYPSDRRKRVPFIDLRRGPEAGAGGRPR